MLKLLNRTVLLLTLGLSASALADTLTVLSSGLPAGLTGTATIGAVSVPLGSRATLAPGTYTVTPRAVADGGKVYVGVPVRTVLKGSGAVTVRYTKLPPGSPDPFFGKGGIRDTNVPGLETTDNWQVITSGPALPVMTTTGSFQDHRVALLTLNGTLIGPVASVTSASRPLAQAQFASPLLRDGTGLLVGLSYLQGAVVRYTAQGQPDAVWRAAPELGPYVRGLLRLPDGGVLAYGGQSVPEVWKMGADGRADPDFGSGGVLSMPALDQELKLGARVKAAQVLTGGGVRLVMIEGQTLLLVDLVDGQPRKVARPLTLPGDAQLTYEARNVLASPDGSVLVVTIHQAAGLSRLVRVTKTGQLDVAFRSPEVQEVTAITGLAVQANGKVLVAYRQDRIDGRGLVMRFNRDGSVDSAFGQGGRVRLKDPVSGVEIAGDGKLKVVSAGLARSLVSDSAYIRILQLLTE